jgi:hypothetical protein
VYAYFSFPDYSKYLADTISSLSVFLERRRGEEGRFQDRFCYHRIAVEISSYACF